MYLIVVVLQLYQYHLPVLPILLFLKPIKITITINTMKEERRIRESKHSKTLFFSHGLYLFSWCQNIPSMRKSFHLSIIFPRTYHISLRAIDNKNRLRMANKDGRHCPLLSNILHELIYCS